jgi:WD40 repeat protein
MNAFPASLEGHPMAWTVPEEIRRLIFSPSGLLLATTRCSGDDSETDALRLWDAISGRQMAELTGIDPVFSLAFVSERELMMVQDGGCQIWDADSGDGGSRRQGGGGVPAHQLLRARGCGHPQPSFGENSSPTANAGGDRRLV